LEKVLRTRGWREMESVDLDGRVKVSCAKGNNGSDRILVSAVDFGPGEEVPHFSSRTAG